MRALYPVPDPDPDLDLRYAWPDEPRPWVRAVMVGSLDGAVEAGGRSAGVATAADRRVFVRLRRSADVVLVGAGTVRAEDYRGVRRRPGGGAPPPVAVVTRSAALDPSSRLFTDTVTAPIVLTGPDAPADRLGALRAAGADVVVLGGTTAADVLGELGGRGLRRVVCEGGPALLGSLLDDDAVDELCLTLAPVLVGGPADRIVTGARARAAPRAMALTDVLEEDGTLLLRHTRIAGQDVVTPPNG